MNNPRDNKVMCVTPILQKSVRNCKDSFYLKLLLNIAIKSASWKYAGVFPQKELVGVYLTKNTNKVSRHEDQPQTLLRLFKSSLATVCSHSSPQLCLFSLKKRKRSLKEVFVFKIPHSYVIKLQSQNIK